MDTLRVFVRWLEAVDGVEQDLSQKVLSPAITPVEPILRYCHPDSMSCEDMLVSRSLNDKSR